VAPKGDSGPAEIATVEKATGTREVFPKMILNTLALASLGPRNGII
jgi:hypothetical protein